MWEFLRESSGTCDCIEEVCYAPAFKIMTGQTGDEKTSPYISMKDSSKGEGHNNEEGPRGTAKHTKKKQKFMDKNVLKFRREAEI